MLVPLHAAFWKSPSIVKQTVTVSELASSITTERIATASAVHQAVVTSQDLGTIPLAARSFANQQWLCRSDLFV